MNDQPSITINEFLAQAPSQLELRVLAGERGAAERELTTPRIQKLGLALAGFTHYIHSGRLQIVGQSEIWFLGQLDAGELEQLSKRETSGWLSRLWGKDEEKQNSGVRSQKPE